MPTARARAGRRRGRSPRCLHAACRGSRPLARVNLPGAERRNAEVRRTSLPPGSRASARAPRAVREHEPVDRGQGRRAARRPQASATAGSPAGAGRRIRARAHRAIRRGPCPFPLPLPEELDPTRDLADDEHAEMEIDRSAYRRASCERNDRGAHVESRTRRSWRRNAAVRELDRAHESAARSSASAVERRGREQIRLQAVVPVSLRKSSIETTTAVSCPCTADDLRDLRRAPDRPTSDSFCFAVCSCQTIDSTFRTI